MQNFWLLLSKFVVSLFFLFRHLISFLLSSDILASILVLLPDDLPRIGCIVNPLFVSSCRAVLRSLSTSFLSPYLHVFPLWEFRAPFECIRKWICDSVLNSVLNFLSPRMIQFLFAILTSYMSAFSHHPTEIAVFRSFCWLGARTPRNSLLLFSVCSGFIYILFWIMPMLPIVTSWNASLILSPVVLFSRFMSFATNKQDKWKMRRQKNKTPNVNWLFLDEWVLVLAFQTSSLSLSLSHSILTKSYLVISLTPNILNKRTRSLASSERNLEQTSSSDWGKKLAKMKK